MFELQEEESKITKLGPRDEKHGDNDVLAVDVYIHVLMPNTSLVMFHSMLRSFLFYRRDESQAELMEDDHRPDVRFPELKVFAWHVAYKHAQLTVHHGSKKKYDIVFEDCTLDRFKLEPRKNGQCMVMFRAQVHPTEEQGARLLALLGQTFRLSIADGEDDENYSQATLDGIDEEDDESDSDVVDAEFKPVEDPNDPDFAEVDEPPPDHDAGDGSLFANEQASAVTKPGLNPKDAWPFPGDGAHRRGAAARAKQPEAETPAEPPAKPKRGRRARVASVD